MCDPRAPCLLPAMFKLAREESSPRTARAYTDTGCAGQLGGGGLTGSQPRRAHGGGTMPARHAFLTGPVPPRPRPNTALSGVTTALAALVVVLLPAGAESASLWAPLVALFPDSARSCFALACAASVGVVAGLIAEAVGRRDPVRPALTAALGVALLAPPGLAVPLWPALLAAAGLIACPVRRHLVAANDDAPRPHANPFALAA